MKKETEKKEIKPKPKKKAYLWPLIILVLSVSLSLFFSLLSEIALTKSNIIVASIVIFVFIAVSILFDMIGLAVATCTIEPFTAMAAKKVKGSKQALSLIKNADRVSSICNDVVGDVCGILAGAAGASIVAKIALTSNGDFLTILIPSLISAIIAGLTIYGKAVFKRFAINHCNTITLTLAKFLNFFTKKG